MQAFPNDGPYPPNTLLFNKLQWPHILEQELDSQQDSSKYFQKIEKFYQ